MARPNLSSCPKQKWTADAKLAKNPSHFSDLAALAVGVSRIIQTVRLAFYLETELVLP
ncbi:hypothetical protein [Paenibacillus arenosi]|uniref:Uncharacterized protein n=1 Tax=Paenibacillus arenosi TaxID=2774142 RepID=A0ABR9AZS1_9BACL|nr:hypothetical protein [Paenibacillus arenosi]MBD8499651.1 hypothetical protein [Paenibacillus arenosi]